MTRLKFFKSCIKVIAFVSVILTHVESLAQAQSDEPNIIVIYTDDWGYSDVSIHDILDDVATPNIDALAQSGVLFSDGYVTSPQCAPSRAGFLTCKYQQSYGFDAIPSLPLNDEEKTIADHLKSFGYKTGMVGKWHLDIDPWSVEWAEENYPDAIYKDGNRDKVDVDAIPLNLQEPYFPGNRGFDEYYWGTRNSYLVNFPPHEDSESGETISVGGDRVDQKTDASIDFIERNANKDAPFFLYTAYYAPHTPLTPTDKYLDQIPDMDSEVRRKGLALMLAVDEGVGQIVQKLKDLNIYDNTIVIFASDNGAVITQYLDAPGGGRAAYSYVDENHPLYTDGMNITWDGSDNKPLNGDKGMVSEGGIRVPMVMSWPGKINAGQTSNKPVNTLDLAKTLLNAGGDVSTLPELEGVDLLPYLNGEDDDDLLVRPLFWRFYTQTAIRKGKWKLLRVSDEMEFLFDLNEDKEEKNNLIEQYPETAESLRDELIVWVGTLSPTGLPDGPLTGAETMKYELYFNDDSLSVFNDLDKVNNMFKVYRDGDLLYIISQKIITNVSLIDSFGRVVKEIPDGQTKINISGLAKGVYIVIAKNQNKMQAIQVVL